MLHDILANASTTKEAEDYLAGSVLQGIVQEEEGSIDDQRPRSVEPPRFKGHFR